MKKIKIRLVILILILSLFTSYTPGMSATSLTYSDDEIMKYLDKYSDIFPVNKPDFIGDNKERIKNAVVLKNGKSTFFVNGIRKRISNENLDAKVCKINNTVMVPAIFFCEQLGLKAVENGNIIEITDDSVTVKIEVNKDTIVVNGKTVKLPQKTQTITNLVYTPLDMLVSALNKEMFTYEDKELYIISDKKDIYKISETKLLDNLDVMLMSWSSADVSHPIETNFAFSFAEKKNSILTVSVDTLKEQVKSYMDMPEKVYMEEIRSKTKAIQFYNSWEPNTAVQAIGVMGEIYNRTKDENYARRVVLGIYMCVFSHAETPNAVSHPFHTPNGTVSNSLIRAYDLTYNSAMWDNVSTEYNQDVKNLAEKLFIRMMKELYKRDNQTKKDPIYTNVHPYAFIPICYAAVAMNEPLILEKFLPWIDSFYEGASVDADGMWQEGTISYHSQTFGQLDTATKHLDNYITPEGYTPPDGFLFTGKGSINKRWPLIEKTNNMTEKLKYPDSSNIALHDAHVTNPYQKSTEFPIWDKYTNNVEMSRFGLFTLNQGDAQDTTSVSLFSPSSALHGHSHDSDMAITLWGAGMEMLPDTGYVTGTEANRYQLVLAPMHNLIHIYSKDSYIDSAWNNANNVVNDRQQWNRPFMHAYDDGSVSNKQVQVVELEALRPYESQNLMKRRMEVLVKIDDNRSYVLDLSRMKGGEAHQSFLKPMEDELAKMTTNSLELVDTKLPSMVEYYGGSPANKNAASIRYKPQVGSGEKDFNFSFKGEIEGSSIGIFMNGVPGAESIFTRIPTQKLVRSNNGVKDDYPGWHFERRRIVEKSDITFFGGVYETWRDNQKPLVKDVKWINSIGGNPMANAAIVSTTDYEDTVYISDDTMVRDVGGAKISGKLGILRKNRKTGEVIYGYTYGNGSIKYKNYELVSKEDVNANVKEIINSSKDNKENVAVLDCDSIKSKNVDNAYIRFEFGDGSGFGLPIKSVENNNVIIDDTALGFSYADNMVTTTHYPKNVTILGTLKATVNIPTFKPNEKQ